jgi:hypothetical protein
MRRGARTFVSLRPPDGLCEHPPHSGSLIALKANWSCLVLMWRRRFPVR